MLLPKLYRVVEIEYWSLRNRLGSNYRFIFDIDTKVKRTVRRVRVDNGWKWQIVNFDKISKYDYFVEQDQEILDMRDEIEGWE